MRRSCFFCPTLRETPAEAQVASHRMMLRAGMIHQTTSGIYAWLPLGTRVLKKIENIVREEQDKAGCQEVLLPTIQPTTLWAESGRYEAYGPEVLRINDRHDREYFYAPTAEEAVTDAARNTLKSYRDLPQCLYQIHWKFRDEIRPRFGVMRGREFLMKDAYSFDLTAEDAQKTYYNMFKTYLKTFARMGLTAFPVQADTGPIGGNLSHEFHILAQTGESTIYYDAKQYDFILKCLEESPETLDIDQLIKIYISSDEQHSPENCPVDEADLSTAKGIELGHIFYIGNEKYSQAMNLKVADRDGNMVYPYMGCYGIGISRLVAGIIEAFHDEKGIKWPEAVAPYQVGLINLKVGDETCDTAAETLYHTLQNHGVEVLYDDRNERAGVKFADMDLLGMPWHMTVGPRGLKEGRVELKNRHTGEKEDISVEQALDFLINRFGFPHA